MIPIERFGSGRIKEYEGLIQTNWWVITGGPSTGKTTLLEELARRGYKTKPEAARVYIDDEINHGMSIGQIRVSESGFQEVLIYMKEGIEDAASPNDLIFWDRGLHGDSMAYFALSSSGDSIPRVARETETSDRLLEGDIRTVVTHSYRGVFLLDRLPYVRDYARTEDETQANRVHSLIGQMYGIFGYQPIRVPVLPVVERAQFVVDRVRELVPTVPNLSSPQLTLQI